VLTDAGKRADAALDDRSTTRVIGSQVEWSAIRDDWEALYAVSPTASIALDYEWLESWWQTYSPGMRAPELCVITVWRGARLIGAIPLYLRQEMRWPIGLRRLGFLSTGEAEFEETCADYLNVLFMPDEEAVCVSAVWQVIRQLDWDHLELLDLPADTPLLNSPEFPGNARLIERGGCPIADLDQGFEGYLGKLSPNRRQNARRLMREAEKAGATFELVGAADAAETFDDLVRLHQARWEAEGKPGVFGAPRFREFHRSLVRQWLPGGRAVLARLSLGAEPAAVLYGFVLGTKFDFYQSGVQRDSDGLLKSPGNLAHLLLMKSLAARGITAYDFLRGSASHKERQATRRTALTGVEVWRPTFRSALYKSATLAGRILRRGIQIARLRLTMRPRA